MNEQRKLAIYGAERLFKTKEKEWYHAFLMLMDETDGEGIDARVLEQLHFSDGMEGEVHPNLRDGVSNPERFRDFTLCRYVVGEERLILPRWNHGLKYAQYVKGLAVPFQSAVMDTPKGNNCRSGVIAALDAMDLVFQIEFARSSNGTKSELMPSYWPYDGLKVQGHSLDAIRSDHERLRKPLLEYALG